MQMQKFVKTQTEKTVTYLVKIKIVGPYAFSYLQGFEYSYLGSPSGIKISYSDNESDYKTGDRKTVIDSHAFLLKLFELYPEFILNPFYISGESHAGVYLPTLASEIVKGLDASSKPILNFKGYMVEMVLPTKLNLKNLLLTYQSDLVRALKF